MGGSVSVVMKNINKTLLFLMLTFGISFSLAFLFILTGRDFKKMDGFVLSLIYMFVPMISAVIVQKFIHREKLNTGLYISFKVNRWFFVAWILPVIMSLATFAVSLLLPEVSFNFGMEGFMKRFEGVLSPDQMEEMQRSLANSPIHPFWITIIQSLIAGVTVNAVAGFGEEAGWRGFLLRELRGKKFWVASLIIGFIWGIWHVPLILMGHNYPQHPELGVLLMTLWCILLSPLFVYITIKAKSVIAAAIFHGSINASYGLAIMLIDGGSDLTVGMTGLAGFISLTILLVFIFAFDRYISNERVMNGRIGEFL